MTVYDSNAFHEIKKKYKEHYLENSIIFFSDNTYNSTLMNNKNHYLSVIIADIHLEQKRSIE